MTGLSTQLPPCKTICILGCGNQGTAILSGLLTSGPSDNLPFGKVLACVRSETSQQRLAAQLPQTTVELAISRNDNDAAVHEADIVILGVDPADIESVLTPHIRSVLGGKLLISVAAGWSREKLEKTLYGSATTFTNQAGRAYVTRALPNVCAQVGEAITAIEVGEPPLPGELVDVTDAIFQKIGRTVRVPPRLMDTAMVLGGSTTAFFAVICDAMIDAAVAVGFPRNMAHQVVAQSMRGTAALLQEGTHPSLIKDQGTSPEGCTIGGLMVMEEAGVRGHIGRAVRESVTVARLMEDTPHVNDTRPYPKQK